MAHFAQIDENNIVIRIVPLANSVIHKHGRDVERLGINYLHDLFGGTWVQTSYNGSFRKNFAGKGYYYDAERDAFIPPQPFNSWTLNEETCQWEAPTPIPDQDLFYNWDEETLSWVVVE